jgi:hypothetical protein
LSRGALPTPSQSMAAKRTATVIPAGKNRKVQISVGDYIYALRYRIERCFNKLKNSRLPVSMYELP